MIFGIGIDLIELNRIEASIRKDDRLVKRILTEQERKVYEGFQKQKRKIEYLAGRFAAKEAFSKAAGTGIGQLSFQHIEVLNLSSGAPVVKAQGFSNEKCFVSISHSEHYATAQVIITE